ncbi:hypothetical protein EsH8_III_001215 [Colletotrichum jinshuiense]
MDFILESRVPKGGGGSSGGGGGRGGGGSKSSKSKSKSKSKPYKSKGGAVVPTGGGGGGNGGGFSTLPLWARILIIVLIVWFIIFLIAFTYYLIQEFKRKKEGKPFRLGRVFGYALLASTGLWLPFFLYKKFVTDRKGKDKGSGSSRSGGVYAKIEEGRAADDGNGDSWYAGAGAKAAESKYEPMGYAPHRPQTPVPPYAPPATAAEGGAAPMTGAAADYYMPQPPSNTAHAQHPPQYS